MRSILKVTASTMAFVLVVGTGAAQADTIANAQTEYLNRIKVGQTIQPLGETPFGESVSLYTGGISFRQTDISLPGIGPDIQLTRTYEATGSPTTFTFDLAMGDWDLAIPQITTIIPGNRASSVGVWNVVDESASSAARCTRFGPISQAPYGYGMAWWHGYSLVGADGNSQPLLKRVAENTLAPGGNTAAYPVVTASHWMLSCLPQTSNGMPGEAFLATSPDGTRTWFNHLSYGPSLETLIEQILYTNRPGGGISGDGGAGTDVFWGYDEQFLPRQTGHLYATRVEDRFGNWVAYRYEGDRLAEITASDGRHVAIAWRTDAPLVDSITVQPGLSNARVWRYQYSNPTDRTSRSLTGVLQPDNSSWSLTTRRASARRLPPPDPDNRCGLRYFTQIPADDNIAVIDMVHPTGLEGRFNLSLRAHARSWVPTECVSLNKQTAPVEQLAPVYLSLSLTSKTFSGPGVAPMTWMYRYSQAIGSSASECAASPCSDSNAVEVTDPSNNIVRYVHSTRWGATEGKLLATISGITQPGQVVPVGLQTIQVGYANPAQSWPYPARIGQAMKDPMMLTNDAPTERLTPEVLTSTERQGLTFSRQVQSFDRFGHPETVVRTGTATRTETTQYWPVDARWVLGQPWKVSVGADVVSQTDYDARHQPLRIYNFGLLAASYGYAPNGMLQTITDPLGNLTLLSNHKRAVPQSIEFADGTSVAPAVDDFGQITAVRNQLNDSTSYLYDSMGRLTRLDYPANDSVAWNPVNRSFGRFGDAAFGLPSGHWRQSVTTGAARTTTFYDALWRPRLTLVEDLARPGSQSFVVKRFDDDGREVFSAYPVSSLTSVDQVLKGVHTEYDALGRVTNTRQDSELGELSTSREYLPGFKTRVTNPRQFHTTTSYQAFDTPSEETPLRIEAPEGVTTVIERDVHGKPLTITRSGPAG